MSSLPYQVLDASLITFLAILALDDRMLEPILDNKGSACCRFVKTVMSMSTEADGFVLEKKARAGKGKAKVKDRSGFKMVRPSVNLLPLRKKLTRGNLSLPLDGGAPENLSRGGRQRIRGAFSSCRPPTQPRLLRTSRLRVSQPSLRSSASSVFKHIVLNHGAKVDSRALLHDADVLGSVAGSLRDEIAGLPAHLDKLEKGLVSWLALSCLCVCD